MTTFEKVKRNILEDMERTGYHTPESWANILLTNTCRLTDDEEQKKFWRWLMNPEDEDRPEMEFESVDPARVINIPEHTMLRTSIMEDEKEEPQEDIDYCQITTQQGGTCYIRATAALKE